MHEFTIRDDSAFNLRVKTWKCSSPPQLNAIAITKDSKSSTGEVVGTYTHELFLTDSELATFVQGLSSCNG